MSLKRKGPWEEFEELRNVRRCRLRDVYLGQAFKSTMGRDDVRLGDMKPTALSVIYRGETLCGGNHADGRRKGRAFPVAKFCRAQGK